MSKKNGIRERYQPERVMANWRELMEAIPHMNEEELIAALKLELERPKADRRSDFIIRLHRRITTLQINEIRDHAEKELREYLP